MTATMNNPSFTFLKTEEMKPQGWLLQQLKIQAAGLSGNLDRFWADIMDSEWIGGSAEGWERVPYWLDGFIPLAWLLDDEDMKARANAYMNSIIARQSPDGWICPDNNSDRSVYDVWALFLMLKVFIVYHNATGDSRIEEVVKKALLALDKHIDGNTLFDWAHTRWYEALLSIYWLYERTGEDWLINLASKLHAQGFDWQSFFKLWPYTNPDEKGRWSQMSHVVNNAMMLKSGPLLWRLTGSREDLLSSEMMVQLLDKYHGMVTGVFTGDECLNGRSPIQGTELCAVVEYMYSLEWMLAITGNSNWGDLLEKITFNALPAAFSPDMWSHQYDQQVNQAQCSFQKNPIFGTNNGYSHTFGLEPNYGCCTANLSQGWPKFALSTFLRSEDGLVAAAYAPCRIKTKIGDTQVIVNLETEYPFRETLNFTVSVDREVTFTFYLRIPAWAEAAILKLDGKDIKVKHNEFYKLKNKWVKETKFSLQLNMTPKVISRPNELAAVSRGPLIYSLPIGEQWHRINEKEAGHEFPHCDYEIHPTTPWNYGLCINKDNPQESITFEERQIKDCPFSPEGAPVVAKLKGKKVDWELKNGSAAPSPGMKFISEETEDITMIPYGCTNLRITEMPIVK